MPTIYTDKPLPVRSGSDLYETPIPVIEAAMRHFVKHIVGTEKILDIGANDGRWGLLAAKYSGVTTHLVGVDIRPLPRPEGFTLWHTMDYARPIEVELMPVKRFDLVVSNPPFCEAEVIVNNAWRQLKNGGAMLFLLPSHFWYSAGRFRGLWRNLPPCERCSVVNRIPFTGGSNPNLYDLYLWRKGEDGKPVGVPNQTRNTQIMF